MTTLTWKCACCKKEQHNDKVMFGNNGMPVVNGVICNDCNVKIILTRLRRLR